MHEPVRLPEQHQRLTSPSVGRERKIGREAGHLINGSIVSADFFTSMV